MQCVHIPMRTRRGLVLAGLTCGLALVQAAAASAASFSVNPTQVFLSASAKSALVTIKNESDKAIRFQLSVVAWSQDPAGQIVKTPTTDVVFYPQLLTLARGEERKVRVGVVVPAGNAEKTYRLFVEELPPLDAVQNPGSVAMLTRMGIPIFLRPDKPVVKASLDQLTLRQDLFLFTLRNAGNAHFIPDAIRITGQDASGVTLFDQPVTGWYILAGGTRTFEWSVPADRCAAVRQFTVEARAAGTVLKETLQAPSGACAR